MKNLHSISLHLHWITMCCFLLPFFYDSCSTKKTDETATDSTAVVVPVDTLQENTASKNCMYPHSAFVNPDSATIPKNLASPTSKDKTPVENLVTEYPVIKPILIPSSGTQTGLAGIVNTASLFPLFALTITFLLLLIGLLAKCIDKTALKSFLLIEVFAIACVSIARPPFYDYDTLWGYWICFTCLSALLLLDTYRIFKKNAQTQ